MISGHRKLIPALLLGAAFASFACDEKTENTTSRGDAGPLSDKPAIDPNLAEAVQAASASARKGKAPRGSEQGPPPNGVFAPGQADKELAAGSPARITLGGEGSEPRVLLADAQPQPGSKHRGALELQLTTGPRQGLPPMEFALGFQAQKSATGSADDVDVVATVTGVKLQPSPGVPAELGAELGKLKGSKVEYRVSKNGAGNDFRYTLAKGADPGLDNALRSLTEALSTMTLPFPDKPLGAGAYFMAVTREQSVGAEVVAYRLVKVAEVKGDRVTLNINTKRYATSPRFEMPGVPKELGKLSLQEFESTADGKLDVQKGVPLPITGELTQALNVGVKAEKQPEQPLGLQAQARAKFQLSGAPAAAAAAAK
ncbi:MAG TPA: hypothetical protein VI072_33330 [Polyangiaceae bacterium]